MGVCTYWNFNTLLKILVLSTDYNKHFLLYFGALCITISIWYNLENKIKNTKQTISINKTVSHSPTKAND